jgi:hypothetical protein
MNWRGTVVKEREDGGGGKRGFSLTPTRVRGGRGSRHNSRRGFPSKYKREGGGVAKREVKGGFVCRCLLIYVSIKQMPCFYVC